MDTLARKILDVLAAASRDGRVDYTDVPPDYRPPRLMIEFDSPAALRDFKSDLEKLKGIAGHG